MKELIQSNRHRLERDTLNSPDRCLFSPAVYSQYRDTLPVLREYASGRLIDLGCGDMPFRDLILDQVISYDSIDRFPRTPEVTFVGDIQDMSLIANGCYDTAICLEVLEHVPDPLRAVREVFRILKPSGIFIVSVPHLSRLHDEPYDYYRFTRHGLKYILESGGFEILRLDARGGIVSFLGHQFSTIVLGIVWQVPILKNIAWFLNSWLVTRVAYTFDKVFYTRDILPLGYCAVARKT